MLELDAIEAWLRGRVVPEELRDEWLRKGKFHTLAEREQWFSSA